jgi:hypothetical protein
MRFNLQIMLVLLTNIFYISIVSVHVLNVYSNNCDFLSKQLYIPRGNIGITDGNPKGVEYVPAEIESYEIENADALGYGKLSNADPSQPEKNKENMSSGCLLYRQRHHPMRQKAQLYIRDLKTFNQAMNRFHGSDDVRTLFKSDLSNRDTICKTLHVNSNLTQHGGNYQYSNKLSFSSSFGFIEPLAPPLRHPKYCLPYESRLLGA